MQEINLLVEQKKGSPCGRTGGVQGDGVYRRIPAGSKKDGGKPA